mmetsp:Transcript_7294/g.21542  ORF Transcript_7294/g.21542 Transcript_7294/m.21542 type:complete len:298 (+) Transcript_7294:1283-2176(+)
MKPGYAPPPPAYADAVVVNATAPPSLPIAQVTPSPGEVVGIVQPNEIAPQLTVADRLHHMQQELDLPEEIVTDLMSIAGTDVVVVADDSGSMNCVANPENHMNPQTRWEELRTTLIKLAHMLLVVDHTDGFHVQFLNDPTWHEVHTKQHVEALFMGRRPGGRTPLAERLRPILDGSWHPKGHSSETEVILLVMTDGEPSDCTFDGLKQLVQQKVANVFVTFLMCTEEDDVVDQYNKYLDHIPGVDITDDYASEKKEVEALGRKLSYYKWLAKATLGGKMPKYDKMDEAGKGGCCVVS